MRRCLEDAIVAQMLQGRTPPSHLRLDIELRITSAGPLEAITVRGDGDAELRACVETQLKGMSFPRSARSTVFRYPLVFTPKVVGK